MAIVIKQPLTLADNLSAFDPETPLIVSDSLRESIEIPVADMSAVSTSKASRAKIVTGFSNRDFAGKIELPKNIETIQLDFDTTGQRALKLFSQEVKYVFVWLSGTGGTVYGQWLSMWIPENVMITLQAVTPYFMEYRTDRMMIKVTGTFSSAWCIVHGYY